MRVHEVGKIVRDNGKQPAVDQDRIDPEPCKCNGGSGETEPERSEPRMAFCRAVQEPYAEREQRDIKRDQDCIVDEKTGADRSQRRNGRRKAEATGGRKL